MLITNQMELEARSASALLSLFSDYGYYRPDGQDKCVKEPNFKGPEIDVCFRGHEEKVISEG